MRYRALRKLGDATYRGATGETSKLPTEAPVPVVLSWFFDDQLDSIGFDNAQAGALAARHPLALGQPLVRPG